MNELTVEFPKYDLEEINVEFLEDASIEEKNYILPKSVGGSKVHLLLGIKNTKVQPVLLKVLTSGVGVYLSPFKDVNDSRIIYAGSSKYFTRMDKEQNLSSNYAIYTVHDTGNKTNIECTEHYKEYRFESINKVGISPLFSTIEVMDANLELVAFSDPESNFSDLKPDFFDLEPDFSDPEPDFPDFKTDFSDLEIKPMAVCGNKFGKITAK